MEENKESRDSIRGIKIALMGPLGGIGDALFWFTLLPIAASVGVSLGIQGNIAGPIIFLLVFNIVHLFLRFFLMHYSYKMGVGAIEKLKDDTQYVTNGSLILGLTVIGGLIASFVRMNIAYVVNLGSISIDIQKDIIDKIYTLFMFYLLKKGKKPIFLIVVTLVIGIVGKFFGVL